MSLATFMQATLDCVEQGLTEAGRPVGLASLTPGGPPAWDNCCEGSGQLWVRLVQLYPTMGKDSPFPQVDTQQQGCKIHGLAARLAVGVMRCVHTIDTEAGIRFPSDVDLTGDTVPIMDDAETVLAALLCCVKDLPGIYDKAFKLDTWQPQGASGGCAGGEWQFLVCFDVCACPEPSEEP